MRVGLVFMGDESVEIWGSAITTLYLGRALQELGVEVWRASATTTTDWSPYLEPFSDMVIAEGVPAKMLPEAFWVSGSRVVFWALSSLYYSSEDLRGLPYQAVATNSDLMLEKLRKAGVTSSRIDLAASDSFLTERVPVDEYKAKCVYLGCYPHKSDEQMQMLFVPASSHELNIWGYGWEDSPYATYYRGALPLDDIPKLYSSVDIVLALTEERQKNLGMVNNRMFEALACGVVVLSDSHPSVEDSNLGQFLNFVSSQEEAQSFLDRFFSDKSFRLKCSERARQGAGYVLQSHTYRDRASKFLDLYREIRSKNYEEA
jgi:Glycosyl transferases group 1